MQDATPSHAKRSSLIFVAMSTMRSGRAVPIARRALTRCARLARSALPQACALCARASANALVCTGCSAALPRIERPCARCALPLAGTAAGVCGRCLRHAPPFRSACVPYVYAFPVDRLLHRLKYGGALALAHWAAGAWLECFRGRSDGACTMPRLVVAIPLAPARQRERGFNQAQEIARIVARELALPLAAFALDRVRDTPAQATLPWAARVTNIRGAFRYRARFHGEVVAVVDDVMTTGSTLAEAAHTLLAAGASEVHVWAIARALAPDAA